jgi:hypothetical protein
MVINISIDTTEPLAGTAAMSERDAAIPFNGWFELLRAISALIDPTTIPGDTGRQAPCEPLPPCEQEHDRS